ncbi:uncharacterized protein DUF4397 [Geodermatophilus normandii]|uniref:Uncharacterized protein DUF4397 n=1 Tax=Geodermatophilus normandii TaxID=1137989 RepID=A0A317QGQ1_9ACTN|nr:uncharacterized protein DUF4397 [Geodermatophilus normandii]
MTRTRTLGIPVVGIPVVGMATVAGTGALLALGVAPASAADTATVSVLHAVPDTPVDVYANGERLLDDFQPGTLTDPLSLPAGSYDLALFPPTPRRLGHAAAVGERRRGARRRERHRGRPPDGRRPARAHAVRQRHLGGARGTGPGRRAARRRGARRGRPRRRPGRRAGLSNPDEAALEVPAGTVSADVVLAGTSTVALGPADLAVTEGATTIVYAWGSQDAGFELAVQTIGGGHSAPSGVPGGTAGLADDSLPLPLLGLSALGLAGAGLAARRLATTRA